MASKPALTGAFVDMLKRFCRDVSFAYANEENQLKMLSSSVNLLCNACPDFCVRMFHERITRPYGTRISQRDEQFFLTSDAIINDMDNYVEEDGNIIDVDIDKVISSLRSMWKDMNVDDRDKIWKYMIALTLLTDKIYENVSL